MRRRNFIKRASIAAGAGFTLGQIPYRLLGRDHHLARMASMSDNDRVLIILQLHGGNDGLNMLVPIEQYDLYYSRRANIALPIKNSVRKVITLDSTLPSADQVGLHPDMIDVKDMYDQGRMAVVQGVSYKNNNGSHFRGRDIRFMGGGADDYFSSGWVGRLLQESIAPLKYPEDFPNNDNKDPLAIELGSDVSLIFHQPGNIPTSISLGSNPDNFAKLIEQLEGFDDQGIDPRGKPPEQLANSPYGKELNWILGLEDKTEDYAQRLQEVYLNASESAVEYPERYPFNAPDGIMRNNLSGQLKLIARLLDGGGVGKGVKTKVFLAKIGGFDTHAEQVSGEDPTMGLHAALLYHISSAMKAFQADLRERGLEDRVMTITTSEFGRRIGSNGSFGTDHGTGGPVMIFGKGVNPGVYGTNPDVSKNNVEMQFDYRQLYSAILHDWMEVDKNLITNNLFFGNFIDGQKEDGGYYEPLTIAQPGTITGTGGFYESRFKLEPCFPNPASEYTTVRYYINRTSDVVIDLLDEKGQLITEVSRRKDDPGEHQVHLPVHNIKPGMYIIRMRSSMLNTSQKLVVK